MSNIKWDCEFFAGENEQALFNATLNTIEPEELPAFTRMLNEFLESPLVPHSGRRVAQIVCDGCDDAIVHLIGGDTIDIDSETTFKEMLGLVAGV